MKKKLITIGLIIVMALSLGACGSSKLDNTNAAYAETIINATDNYLDGNISAAEAYDTISHYQGLLESDDISIRNAALQIYIEMGDMKRDGSGSKSDIIKNRNTLARACGEKRRSS